MGLPFALILVALLAVSPTDAAAAQLQGVVPTAYDYRLGWDPSKRRLTGRARLTVRNDGPGGRSVVWLRLRPNAGRRHERISSVWGARVASTRSGGSVVELRLPAELPPGASSDFGFRFALDVSRENTSLGRSTGIDTFGDALPLVAVATARGHRLGPEPTYGEGTLAAVADWTLRLAVPRGLSAALPGRQSRRTTRSNVVFSSSARVRDAAFAVGRLRSRSTTVDGVKIRVLGTSATRSELPAALRRAANAHRQMQRWYGGYDLPDLDVVVVDFPFGGSEYPGLVFSTPDNATIAHEVAHQWFYGLVGSDQYRDPWLDESITAYVENRFHKSYRCDLARPLGSSSRGLATGMDYWERHADTYVDTIYRGGACALTVLEHDLGRATFDRALRLYVARNSNAIADTADFLRAVKEVAPDYDLARWTKLVGLD